MRTATWAAPWLLGLTWIASPGPQAASLPDGTWTLHPRGFGPVRAGMTVADAAHALGVALVPEDPPPSDLGPEVADEWADCHYVAAPSLPGLAFMVHEDRVVRVDVFSESYGTLEGAGIGTPESDVKRFFPRAATEPHPYVDFGHYLVVPGARGTALLFETDGKQVTSLRSGTRAAVSLIEGCS